MKKSLKAVMPGPASEPAAFAPADATAIQALFAGTANESQQKRAMKWILEDACGLPVWAYREGARETDIALGRQFVGQQIVGLSRVNVSKMKGNEEMEHG